MQKLVINKWKEDN